MQLSRANQSTFGRSVARLALVGAFCLGASEMALAADHKISTQTAKVNCSSFKPGDTLTLASGTRGVLTIHNCNGTQANPIVVRNDPAGSGPTIIRRASGTSGGFIFSCNSCVGVEIDGSYKWRGAPSGKTYGIKVTVTGGGAPSAFLKIGGLSRFVTVRNVEIDGAWPRLVSYGSGIRINEQTVKRSKYPSLWREGILIEDNFIHHVALEGMYIGPNYGERAIPLRNIEIRHNRIESIGNEGINTKSMWAGDNRIHHNVIRGVGKSRGSASNQFSGIANESGTVKIYNNWIESTGEHGIHVWTAQGPKISERRGPFEARIWNNVIVDAGGLWRSHMTKSHGIHVGAQAGTEKPVPNVYNNTIVNPRQSGIYLATNVSAGFVRDNIAAGARSNPVIKAPKIVQLVNNRVGAVSQMGFVDPGRLNFRLGPNSPARNAGSKVFPDTDFHDVTRPKELVSDQGAFEGN